MKRVIFALGIIFIIACSKSSSVSLSNTTVSPINQVSVPVINPVYKFQGFNFGLWSKDYKVDNPSYYSDFNIMFNYMKNSNANTIIIDWAVNFNDDGTLIPSTKAIYTPTFKNISDIVTFAKNFGFFVTLKPHVAQAFDVFNRNIWNTDSAKFNPQFIFEWNKYLSSMIDSIPNVDGICFGTELNHVDCGRRDEWINLINNLKSKYKGLLTYDAIFSRWQGIPSVNEVVFWDQLNYISCSLYVPVTKNDNANVNEVIYGWHNDNDLNGNQLGNKGDVINLLQSISTKYNKKIYAMESGYQSCNGGLFNVNDGPSNSKTINNELQANGLSGYFKTIENYPQLFDGVSVWGLHTGTIMQKNNNQIWYNQEFATYGKPASDTIKKYFTK
jgi:hypothetical protein